MVRTNGSEALSVQVSRLRAGLEGALVLGHGLRPYVEMGLRRDGGDAETGYGVDVGGGVRYGGD